MSQSLTNLVLFTEDVRRKIGNTTELSDAEVQAVIRLAVREYSKEVPRIVVQPFTGDGTHHSFTLADFVDRFSTVLSVEYPAGQQTPVLLKDTDYELYRSTTTTVVLRLKTVVPGDGEELIVTYTAPHSVAATSTLPEIDEDAVSCLAAARCCQQLAAHYLRHAERGREAQALEFRSKADDYAAQARRYLQVYKGHMGAGVDADYASALGFAETDEYLSDRTDKFFHPRRWR